PHTSRSAALATLAARNTLLAPCVSNMRRYRSPRLEIEPRKRLPPDECSRGVRPNQLAKWRASLKCVTSPEVGATKAVAVSKPIPGIDSSVVHAGFNL